MFAGTTFEKAMFAMTGPVVPEAIFYAVVAAVVLLPMLITWLVMRSKLKHLQGESSAALKQLRRESGAALQAAQAKAASDAAEHAKNSAAAAASFADMQQRFTTHREVAERRANDAAQQIARLEADLAATREVAAQLVPTQSRIKDLETALAAEQGRMKAQEQAIEATNARAADFEKRMIEAQELLLKQKAQMQETAVELKKMCDEQAAYAAAGGVEAELAKAREATQQAEVKAANLQRALKAAEARAEMVQKEFMNAVGVATVPTPGTTTAASDKKLREMEEKLAQAEAESRKRAREDGYRIAELEYRLSEALEVAKAAESPAITLDSPELVAVAGGGSGSLVAEEESPAATAERELSQAAPVPAVEVAEEQTPMAGIPMTEAPPPGFATLEAPPGVGFASPKAATARRDEQPSLFDFAEEDDSGAAQRSAR